MINVGAAALALCWMPPSWTAAHPELYQAAHTGWGLLALTPSLYDVALIMTLLARSIARAQPPGRNGQAMFERA
jgi:hypothetical protein